MTVSEFQHRTELDHGDSQVHLDGLAVLVRRVFIEVVERITKPGLPEHLQGHACHPAVDIQLRRAVRGNTLRDGRVQLDIHGASEP